jgi:hypothetical protein
MNLFGSTLIKKYFSDFRNPNDVDWITNDVSEMKPSRPGEEFYFMPFAPDREMTPDEIYTVKISHAIYDIHWKKTMSDIRFMQMKGCNIVDSLFLDLRKYWKNVHGDQKRTDFEVRPGNFFEDRVRRKQSHDSLHEELRNPPTYRKFVDEGKVSPERDKFFTMCHIEREDAIFEEAYVIAIERFSHLPDGVAYGAAQQLLVTKLHPEWLADFVIQNWNQCYWTASKSNMYKRYKEIKKQTR